MSSFLEDVRMEMGDWLHIEGRITRRKNQQQVYVFGFTAAKIINLSKVLSQEIPTRKNDGENFIDEMREKISEFELEE